jgi:hypothetical protein
MGRKRTFLIQHLPRERQLTRSNSLPSLELLVAGHRAHACVIDLEQVSLVRSKDDPIEPCSLGTGQFSPQQGRATFKL